MKFLVYLALLVTVWQASAQAPGDEVSRCVNQRRSYPPNTRMLMDSRNYEQLITGSSAVWQTQKVFGAGSGVGSQHKLYSYILIGLVQSAQSLIQYHHSLLLLFRVKIFLWSIHKRYVKSIHRSQVYAGHKHGILGGVD